MLLFCVNAHALEGFATYYTEPSEIVLKTLAMEASGEGVIGMAYVARVIQNRAHLRNSTAEKECLRKKQFSCWNDGVWAQRWLSKYYTPEVRQKAMKAWEEADNLEGAWTHYHTVDIKPYWSKGHQGERAGKHLFYEGVK